MKTISQSLLALRVWILASIFFAVAAITAQAQVPTSLLTPSISESAEETPDSALAEILRLASEMGTRVVIVDGDGGVVADTTESDSGTGMDDTGAMLMSFQSETLKFRTALAEKVSGLPNALAEVIYVLRATSPDGRILTFAEVAVIGLVLLWLGNQFRNRIYGPRIARRFVVARIMENPQGYAEKMPFLVFRFFMGTVGTLVAMIVAYVLGAAIVGPFYLGPIEDSAIRFTITLVNIGFLMVNILNDVWRMILSPYLPQYRIPHLSDKDSLGLYNSLRGVALVAISIGMFVTWVAELGLNEGVAGLLGSLLTLLTITLIITTITVFRSAITNAIFKGKPATSVGWPSRIFAALWYPAILIYCIAAWMVMGYALVVESDLELPLLSGAFVILTVIAVVYGIINYFIDRWFARRRKIAEANEAALDGEIILPEGIQPVPQMRSFEDLARRVAGILAFMCGLYAFAAMWMPDTSMVPNSISERLLDMVAILFLGYIAYHAFRIWIDEKIQQEQGDMPEGELGDEGGATSASRLATLLPLFRNFILIVIVVTFVLIMLMELGVNVGPLFAGAGIVGVAVGFGSQSLVRDIFSGAFFLFDDAFRKGEYLDVGGVKGTVERISVRSFQLRHHLGALHTMPFGEIQVMTNYSRDWVIMKLPLRVTYDTDVEKVRKMIKKLGQELLSDPVIGDNFIQPLKSQGVIEMQDSAMIIRVKFMTKPGDQWLVRKTVYQEIRALFEREGIKFAHREVTVRLADGKKADELDEEQQKAITAAAQASLEEEMLEGGVEDGGDDR